MKEQILSLRSQGLSYNQIVAKLGCSKGTVSYHCGHGQKEKSRRLRLIYARKNIIKLKERAGGECSKCGYDKCYDALEFHHIDPETKKGQVFQLLRWYSYKTAEQEADKCILLCANCHRELHAKKEAFKHR